MEDSTRTGMNRSGAQMAPFSSADISAYAQSIGSDSPPADMAGEAIGVTAATIRATAISEATRIASVPLPGTVKSLLSTTIDKLKGDRPEVLIDKLGERLAFERGGTRLYDALLAKCQAVDGTIAAELTVTLARYRDEEAAHAVLVKEALESLGADATAMTPCADLVGVQAMGLMQSVTDPRTTVLQCLSSVLIAELADNAGWELLISLAHAQGHAELAKRFEPALFEEQQHMNSVRSWIHKLVLQKGG